MNETERQQRNAERLTDCYPAFGARVKRVLEALEAQGLRPRIQDAWRSIEDQLVAFQTGHSAVKFGFHNVTGPGGVKEALAADVLDDDNPLEPGSRYLLALALAARDQGLETLIMWGLTPQEVAAVETALSSRNVAAPVSVGKDPTHVQVKGMSIDAAHDGARPTFGDAEAGRSGEDDMPLNANDINEIRMAVQAVLNEGTGEGQQTWAGTSKESLQVVHHLVNEINDVKRQIAEIKARLG
jgi:hypothetical protein